MVDAKTVGVNHGRTMESGSELREGRGEANEIISVVQRYGSQSGVKSNEKK
jgi:hypothetical protein